jgi:nucleotide-binding universal stress UspA family protein
MFRRILVCLDGSDLAEQILPYAAEQALCFSSTVVLLHVSTVAQDIAANMALSPGRAVPAPPIQDEVDAAHEEAYAYLEGIAAGLRERNLTVDCEVLEGLPGGSIVEFAAANGIELIALSTHGRSGLARTLAGSVADQVIRESSLPVLVMRPRGSE